MGWVLHSLKNKISKSWPQLGEKITKEFDEYLAKTDQFASNLYNKKVIHGSQNCEENTRHAGEGHKETSPNWEITEQATISIPSWHHYWGALLLFRPALYLLNVDVFFMSLTFSLQIYRSYETPDFSKTCTRLKKWTLKMSR